MEYGFLSLPITTAASIRMRLKPLLLLELPNIELCIFRKRKENKKNNNSRENSLKIQKYKKKLGKLSFLLKKIVYTYAAWGFSFLHLCRFFLLLFLFFSKV